MLGNEGARDRVNSRFDDVVHELCVPLIELAAWKARQRTESEFKIFNRIERTVLVLLIKCLITLGKRYRIDSASADQKLAPLIV